ncbi:YccS family putative transporter [Acerihabitans sp. TG2]|uniref:YccS family putative transporter n=1 Tax=Acerihabitans sp. TG2 TaxID=3096008 RepID=UPI002B23D02E|nr:YccS family putative transporter [Acerihabitans sp. TG2]MEA9390684.1 YccS family putative transporter [Acerihabitans sp. TG2]
MLAFAPGFRHFAFDSRWRYSLRILFALSGAAALPWWLHMFTLTIPLTLGVVAAALADLDDRLSGRLRNLFITLISFFIAAVSIELLIPYPWLFIVGLAGSTCGFILLGALGQRYATIAFGALLIAVYTMLGASMYQTWYTQPALLLVGAIWYNLLTLFGHLLFPIRPLQDNLARCYTSLALFLDAKANLFDPDTEDADDSAMIDVAMANSKLVQVLNQTKASLLTRLRGDRGQRGTRRTLHYYFVAQDIHERASSSHVQYQQLREQLRYSDVLFRFQRLLALQAKACHALSQSILLHQKYQHDSRFERVFNHLSSAIDRLITAPPQIKALKHLLNNLRAIDAQLATIESEQAIARNAPEENNLADDKLTGWNDIRLRIKRNLTPESALFRHAVRMSVVLCIGYAFIQLSGLHYGYWILLTSLFVCQPNYQATRRRLALRIIGTLAGVLLGLPILYFVPSTEGQMILIVLSGTLFFAFRNVQYAQATMFITLLVMLCFNLLGEGFEVALPRVFDTFVGCAIAWAAVSFIWPDWHFRRLPQVMNNSLAANCRYLDAILVQYHQGKDNRLDYRVARRDAHNRDAELASVVSNMSADPKTSSELLESAFRLLCLNHTFLSYISTLGAHREDMANPDVLQVLDDAACYIDDALQYQPQFALRVAQEHEKLVERIRMVLTNPEAKEQVVLQQIGLLLELLPELIARKQEIETQF